jgi:hypothetical protein
MDAGSLYAGFVRQRRFLIVVSLALAAAGYLGLTLDKVDVLGNSAIIGRPDRVLWLGYICWGWALLRYIQWFNDCGAWAETKSAHVEAYQILIRRHAESADIPRHAIDEATAKTVVMLTVKDPVPPMIFRSETSQIRWLRRQPGQLGQPVAADLFAVAYIPVSPYDEQAMARGSYRIDLNQVRMKTLWLRASLQVALTKRHFLEYFAPYVIALLPLLALIFRR